MPGDEQGHQGEGAGVQGARLLVITEAEILGYATSLAAIIKRHHENADKAHGGNGQPIEVVDDHAVFSGARGLPHHFQGAEVRRHKGQARYPGRNGSAGKEEILAGLHSAAQSQADPQHKAEIDND